MRFTEHEMTTALHGFVKAGLHRDPEQAEEIWRTMPRFPRFERIQMVGEVALPVMVRLPEIDVETGTQPQFSDEQVAETVRPWLEERFRAQTLAQAEADQIPAADAEAEFEHWWESQAEDAVAQHVEYVQGVLAHLPLRSEDAQPADRRAPRPAPRDPAELAEDDLPDLPDDFVIPDHL